MRPSYLALATTALLLLGCGSIGLGPSIIDDAVATSAASTGDAELMADVELLVNKHFRAGSGESQAAMCLQQYVRGSAGKRAIANATDDYDRRVAQSDSFAGFATCKEMCRIAATDMPSKYSPIAAKYQPLCAAASSNTQESIETDHLERIVQTYRAATQPLGLYLADRDAQAVLDHLQSEGTSNETITELASEVASLREASTDAIELGRAFFEGPEAQANFQQRELNEVLQDSIATRIQQLEAEQTEARNAGLPERAEHLRGDIEAARVQLAVTMAEHEILETQYKKMAEDAGVYTLP